MLQPSKHTRRSVIRVCAALLSGGAVRPLFAKFRSGLPVEFRPTQTASSSSWAYRQYAVHASVTLGSIPLLSKKNVGGGAIAIERAIDGDSVWTAVQLVAGSHPERLKGFNRFGATQELIREQDGVLRESGYLSFMTTSRESGLHDARKAFESQTASQLFTFARGRATQRGCAFLVENRRLGARWTWRTCAGLLLDPGLTGVLPPESPLAGYHACCLPTFLFAVHRTVLQTENRSESTYLHNGKVFQLRTERKMEENGSDLRIVTGRIIQKEHHSDFRIWLDPKGRQPLPQRIEYKPREFLSLTLEAVTSPDSPSLRPLLVNRE